MLFSLRSLLVALSVAAVGAFAAACGDKEFISIEPDVPERPIGDACTVDAECASGRCIAGICQDDGCGNDDDCRDTEICVFEVCTPVEEFACEPDEAPLMSVSSQNIDFDQVNLGQTGEETLTVENVGTCLLTLSSVGLDDAGSAGFGCEPCDPSVFPQYVPPGQTLDIIVRYSPPGAGEADSTLFIRSDDVSAGDEGLVAVALHADYDGEPLMVITPVEVNFGRVEFEAGGVQGEATETIEITNRGTGNAALIIERLFVNNGVDFVIPDEFDNISPDSPLLIAPFDPNDASTTVSIPVTFRPTRNANLEDELVVRAQGLDNVTRLLRGTSLGPPEIHVSTGDATNCDDDCLLTFRCGEGTGGFADVCPTGEAYQTGVVTFRTVTITNNGQSELTLNLSFGGEAGDFVASPAFIQPIPAGGSLPLSVFFQPSGPSDAANPFSPDPVTGAFDAVLNITSNDNDPVTDVLKTVTIKGFSKGGQNDQALKLEMNFENNENSWAANDFRDVDLMLESPTGFTCTKNRSFIPDGNGNFILDPTADQCDDWNNFVGDTEGQVNWTGVGQFEEPERIILFGLGPTNAEAQTFTATILYQEDCANIPTGLLADILGIGGSILLGVLGGAVGVPIAVPPDQISDFVSENCFDHASSLVTLHISLDGVEVAAPQKRLDNRGDVFEIAHLQRRSGQFCDPEIGLDCP